MRLQKIFLNKITSLSIALFFIIVLSIKLLAQSFLFPYIFKKKTNCTFKKYKVSNPLLMPTLTFEDLSCTKNSTYVDIKKAQVDIKKDLKISIQGLSILRSNLIFQKFTDINFKKPYFKNDVKIQDVHFEIFDSRMNKVLQYVLVKNLEFDNKKNLNLSVDLNYEYNVTDKKIESTVEIDGDMNFYKDSKITIKTLAIKNKAGLFLVSDSFVEKKNTQGDGYSGIKDFELDIKLFIEDASETERYIRKYMKEKIASQLPQIIQEASRVQDNIVNDSRKLLPGPLSSKLDNIAHKIGKISQLNYSVENISNKIVDNIMKEIKKRQRKTILGKSKSLNLDIILKDGNMSINNLSVTDISEMVKRLGK